MLCHVSGVKLSIRSFVLFLQAEYFVIFGASWFYFGTDTNYSTLPKLYGIGYIASKCLEMSALRIESFPCNHSINAVLTGFSSTTQRIQVNSKQKLSTYDRNRI